jgi:hypothetical protein
MKIIVNVMNIQRASITFKIWTRRLVEMLSRIIKKSIVWNNFVTWPQKRPNLTRFQKRIKTPTCRIWFILLRRLPIREVAATPVFLLTRLTLDDAISTSLSAIPPRGPLTFNFLPPPGGKSPPFSAHFHGSRDMRWRETWRVLLSVGNFATCGGGLERELFRTEKKTTLEALIEFIFANFLKCEIKNSLC